MKLSVPQLRQKVKHKDMRSAKPITDGVEKWGQASATKARALAAQTYVSTRAAASVIRHEKDNVWSEEEFIGNPNAITNNMPPGDSSHSMAMVGFNKKLALQQTAHARLGIRLLCGPWSATVTSMNVLGARGSLLCWKKQRYRMSQCVTACWGNVIVPCMYNTKY